MYQTDPPRSPKEVLPTMYELPSEDPEESGLPDEFHLLQPRLLGDTFCPPNYPIDRILVASDLNLYYDPRYTGWYKRPDWFAWQRTYQGIERQWLRWYDAAGNWVLTPTERETQQTKWERQRVEQERQRAEQAELLMEQERQRAEQAELLMEQERQRAERLAAQLRAMGVDPEQL